MARGLVAMALVAGMASAGAADLARPYLALMTFQDAQLEKLSDEHLRLLEAWPYDGMATWVQGYQALEAVPDPANLEARLDHVRTQTGKHLWPTVFLNRIIGLEAGGAAARGGRGDSGVREDPRVGPRQRGRSAGRLPAQLAAQPADGPPTGQPRHPAGSRVLQQL